jgi:hypothetical protein
MNKTTYKKLIILRAFKGGPMSETITGFSNYNDEVIGELTGLFAEEKIESRPMKWTNNIIWLDANEEIHRENNLPAIERSDGGCEYWIHGVRQNVK